MSDALTPQSLVASPSPAAGPAQLDFDNIQGDILIGLQKKVEKFVFFSITDVAGFKAALHKKITRRITSTRVVHAREFELRDHKNHAATEILPLVGLNLGFTNSGMQKLLPGVDLKDTSYASGAEDQAPSLGDVVDGGGKLTNWKPEFLGKKIDGIFLITGGDQKALDGEEAVLLSILGGSVKVVFDPTGNVRPGLEKGHEHFGWLDGVSQPGVNGVTSPFPGQRMLDPGRFVFGYPPDAAGKPPLPWMKDGSFMVFRRLNQLVPELDNFILDTADTLQMDPVLLGARMVGRWKSGAPLELTPSQDDTTLGADPQQNNNFDFSDDRFQRRCPFGAHIRKTNPREDFPAGFKQENVVDPRRIIRAGIPFGPEVAADEAAAKKTNQERGLMFVCYQTSIPNQFEFVQISWANNVGFIFGKKNPDGSPVTVGFDPIIGQNKGGARSTDEPIPNYPTGSVRSTLNMPNDFIVPTGGAYFFMPSIEAMQNELSS